MEDQAINRAHRIGAERPVTVTRFLTVDTIEQRINQVLERKRELVRRRFQRIRRGAERRAVARRSVRAVSTRCRARGRVTTAWAQLLPPIAQPRRGRGSLSDFCRQSCRICRCTAAHVAKIHRACVCSTRIRGGCFNNATSALPTRRAAANLATSEFANRLPLARRLAMRFACVCRHQFASSSLSGSLTMPICDLPRSGWAFDSATICAWQRTWHGPICAGHAASALLCAALPGGCDREVYAGGWDCAGDALYADSAALSTGRHPGPGWMYPPEAGIGFEPVQFQRLGQIPNDLGLAVRRRRDTSPIRVDSACEYTPRLELRRFEPPRIARSRRFGRQIFADRQIVARGACEYSANSPDSAVCVCGRAAASVDNTSITGGQNTVCFASG